jgi:DNA processing protein
MERLGVQLLRWGHERYPPHLAEIADPPCALYLRGTLEPADRCAVAVVGTRRASSYGRDVAALLSRDLARAGVTVVSGLALGIDGSAHRGALSAVGRTVAVLGCGVDVAYPASHAALAAEIIERGALLSEYPMGSGPEPWRFPARNRIVSGLSLGTVVVEGTEKSGAMITADFAAEQNRDVFAVPGDIRSPRSEGPHRLIQEGAKLVRCAQDIMTELGIVSSPADGAVQLALDGMDLSDEEARVLETLSLQPSLVDETIAESRLTVPQVSAALLTLELKGLIRKLPGNAFVRLHRGGAG